MHFAEEKDKNYKKPKRPCPFCGEFKGRIKDHLTSKHKNEEEVRHALSFPKELRDRAFAKLRKEGIFKANAEMLSKEKVDISKLIKERNQGEGKNIKMCSLCKGFFSAHLIYKHKKVCPAAEGTLTPTSIPVQNLVEDKSFSFEYRGKFLGSFTKAEQKEIILNDRWLKVYGYHVYQNVASSRKREEKRLSLNAKLREIARLFIEFKKVILEKQNRDPKSCSEMFQRRNVSHLQEAIINLTVDKITKKVKNGLQLTLRYLIKNVCEVMKASYLLNHQDDQAEEMDKFLSVLHLLWPSFFKNAEESII